MFISLTVALLAGSAAATAATAACESIQTALGDGTRVQGARSAGGGRAWLGVRFGAARRFQRARRAAPRTDLVMATAPGAACLQSAFLGIEAPPVPGAPPESEDCLTLNVHVPPGACAGEPLPVFVWIHGGGFTLGSAAPHNGDDLAREGRHIVVVPQYRLGALGWFTVPGGDSNNGLWDQQLALEWVRDNIAAFGGDPARVVIGGESAGSMSSIYQLVNPRTRGLFSGVVLQSGGAIEMLAPGAVLMTQAQAHEAGAAAAEKVGCDPDAGDVLHCLQHISVKSAVAMGPALPVLDGDAGVVPDFPSRRLAQGKFHPNVRVLAGLMRDEGTLFAGLGPPPALFNSFGPLGAAVARTYGADGVTLFGDQAITCPALSTARALRENGVPVHFYRVDYASTINTLFPGAPVDGLGAYHAQDVAWLFNQTFPGITPAASDIAVGRMFRAMVSAFVRGDAAAFEPQTGKIDTMRLIDANGRAGVGRTADDERRCRAMTAFVADLVDATVAAEAAGVAERNKKHHRHDDDDDSHTVDLVSSESSSVSLSFLSSSSSSSSSSDDDDEA